MVIIRLYGGLGNQIFQLSAGLLLAESRGLKEIVLDDSALGSYSSKRDHMLPLFFNLFDNEYEIEIRSFGFTKLRLPRFFSLKFKNFPLVSDRNFQEVLNGKKGNIFVLDGYFQKPLTQSLFEKELSLIGKMFLKPKTCTRAGCVVHIRGGDFINLGWNGVASNEYYKNAIGLMKDEFKVNDFFVVTDDKAYARKVLEGMKVKYEFSCGSVNEDFYLIGMFKKRILSASTFAFWASAMGSVDGSVIIAPEYWTPGRKRKIYLDGELQVEE